MEPFDCWIERKLSELDAIKSDDERAHSLEDDIRKQVLHEIASGDFGEATAWAAKALQTGEIDFDRWCA